MDPGQCAQLCNLVFQKLEEYAVSRHSNVITVCECLGSAHALTLACNALLLVTVREFDKDQSGELSIEELQKVLF